jgi:hypothetical protein
MEPFRHWGTYSAREVEGLLDRSLACVRNYKEKNIAENCGGTACNTPPSS